MLRNTAQGTCPASASLLCLAKPIRFAGEPHIIIIAHAAQVSNLASWWFCCRTITLRKDRFDEREDDFYEALYTQSQAQFATYVSTGTVVNNYAHIFDLLIRLRQVKQTSSKPKPRHKPSTSNKLGDLSK